MPEAQDPKMTQRVAAIHELRSKLKFLMECAKDDESYAIILKQAVALLGDISALED